MVLINTFEGSQKHRTASRNPKIALDIYDPGNAYVTAMIGGRIKEIMTNGTEDHIVGW